MSNDRAQSAYDFRVEAANFARNREHPKHEANPDEPRYGTACYPMNFTKGLEHNAKTGLVANIADFEAFRTAIDNGFAEPFTTRVPVPQRPLNPKKPKEGNAPRRQWEAPTAGVVFELEGPDPQAVTMPPAPALCSDELTFEMAEVYELALLRDTPFNQFDADGTSQDLQDAITRLNELEFAKQDFPGSRGRKTLAPMLVDQQTAFRGSSPGVENGPYISQFMLIGNNLPTANKTGPEDGFIQYGAQVIDQRVFQANENDDYMMKWDDWLFVQDGFNPGSGLSGQSLTGHRRFIHTPRDLATYVHVDALYQAYLNACLILLAQGAPFDPAFDLLSGMGEGVLASHSTTPGPDAYVDYNAGGFALWGGPHILSLVTEVATRGLKAVRFQKFNNHLRLRPEALAARIQCASAIDGAFPTLAGAFTKMADDLKKTVKEVRHHNKNHPNGGQSTALLPMAFAEGSPMHPTYGAGHATVAGACVTMLKAFFDTSSIFAKIDHVAAFYSKEAIAEAEKCRKKIEYGGYEVVAHTKGKSTEYKLEFVTADTNPDQFPNGPLTLEGELNKLAANISIGRNMAGVHYYSDYYDSARMGEEIALGILEEQALGYQTDRFVLSVATFDGDSVRIGRR